jgi:hypothetical protein
MTTMALIDINMISDLLPQLFFVLITSSRGDLIVLYIANDLYIFSLGLAILTRLANLTRT